jgi:hypothetical protein
MQLCGREIGKAEVAVVDQQFDLGAVGNDALGSALAKPADNLQVLLP